ncbi:aldo/keto reductase [Streptomyces griseofuscus]|uniref:aldo/keto reductase n=1 Tax=Streptomyces griseofuscus TaxID=146922 RepID=UPI00369031B7
MSRCDNLDRPQLRRRPGPLHPPPHRLHAGSCGRARPPRRPLDRIATAHGARPSWVALARLLARSKVVLPTPGTSKVAHLEEDLAAAALRLTDTELGELTDTA